MSDICKLNIHASVWNPFRYWMLLASVCMPSTIQILPGKFKRLSPEQEESRVLITEKMIITLSWQTKELRKMIHAWSTSETGSSRILQTNFSIFCPPVK